LHLSKDARENSWILLESIKDQETSVPDVKRLFLRASACIWMVQKSTVHSSAFRITTFLNTLPKVTQRITYIIDLYSERGHALYHEGVILPLFEEFRKTLELASITSAYPVATKKLDDSFRIYKSTSELFELYMTLFQILIKYDRNSLSNLHLATNPDSYILDIFRFGWAILIYASNSILI
jgi:hypothetical protein